MHAELEEIVRKLNACVADYKADANVQNVIVSLKAAAGHIAKGWSGSNHGYHALVYYTDFQTPPASEGFKAEWGLLDKVSNRQAFRWLKYSDADVYNYANKGFKISDRQQYVKRAKLILDEIDDLHAYAVSILSTLDASDSDRRLQELTNLFGQAVILSVEDYVFSQRKLPRMSRDIAAINTGYLEAPHQRLQAQSMYIQQPITMAEDLVTLLKRIMRHLSFKTSTNKGPVVKSRAKNVFIGHGRSPLWMELSRFIEKRLGLEVDEFNQVEVAGVSTSQRLEEMLDNSAIAFLIMTGEDDSADGTKHPRMNVIHEVGLFQGRLGFTKAIVLLEDGCAEFSNIHGLSQLRFRQGEIRSVFENVRAVLEREGLITAAASASL